MCIVWMAMAWASFSHIELTLSLDFTENKLDHVALLPKMQLCVEHYLTILLLLACYNNILATCLV